MSDWSTVLQHIKQFPHCDAAILHAPGECDHCDTHPEWQALRMAWGINFTGGTDPAKLPCPSEARRPARMAHMWPGNRPTNVEVPIGPRTGFEHILEDNADDDEP